MYVYIISYNLKVISLHDLEKKNKYEVYFRFL